MTYWMRERRDTVGHCFVLSKTLYKDELKTRMHKVLSWVDFLEMFARTATYRALPPHFQAPEHDARAPAVRLAVAAYVLIMGAKRYGPAEWSKRLEASGLDTLRIEPVRLPSDF